MCGGGGGGAPEAPQEAMPPVSQEQINQAVSLPEGFRAEPVPISQGGGYRILDPSGAVYQQAGTFGDLLAGANQLSIVGSAAEGIYDPETRQFINRTTGEVLDPGTAGQITGIVGGREVGIGRPGEYQPGIADLARGLATQRIDLPERQVAGLTADQQRAFELARSGVGAFQPFLDQATGLTQAGVGALEQARLGTLGLAGQIPGQISGGQQALSSAAQDLQRSAERGAASAEEAAANILQAAQSSDSATRLAAEELMASSNRIGQLAARTEARLLEAGVKAEDIASTAASNARALATPLEARLGEATTGARGAAETGITGADIAAQRARTSTAGAQQSLQEAAQLGRLTAMQGIAQLAGTGTMFSPQQAEAFMNQYEDAAVNQALQDIARQGALQQQEVAARAVQAGAFGGSRQAVAEAELARNILEQQGRTAAQMRAAGAESAAQRAQQAFEQAQARQQNVAQLTGQLGQIGVGASAQAAEAAGRLGLSAEELAQRGALQGAQLGLSAEQFAAANAQAIAQTGLSIEQLAAQTGLSAQQLAGDFAARAGQIGLSAEQQRQAAAAQQAQLAQAQAQLGMQGAQSAGQMGIAGAELGMQGAQAAGNLGLQGAQLGLSGIQAGLGAQQQAAGLGQGIAGLGQQMAGLGQAQQALNLQDINTMLTTGQAQQRQTQAELEAQYANQFQQAMQPFQQLAFASDIITGAPSGQTSIMTQPGPSTASQLVGLGLTVPAVASGIQTLRGA